MKAFGPLGFFAVGKFFALRHNRLLAGAIYSFEACEIEATRLFEGLMDIKELDPVLEID